MNKYFLAIALFSQVAFADFSHSPIFTKCASDNGIPVSNPKDLSPDQKSKIFACVKMAEEAAKNACEQQTGIKFPDKSSGAKQSHDDKHKFKECMKSKGFPGHHHKPSDG